MNKLIFGLTCLSALVISQDAFSIQIIAENRKPSFGQNFSNAVGAFLNANNNYRNQREADEFNRMQEQQQLLRDQVRIQQEMLNLQRHQHIYGR